MGLQAINYLRRHKLSSQLFLSTSFSHNWWLTQLHQNHTYFHSRNLNKFFPKPPLIPFSHAFRSSRNLFGFINSSGKKFIYLKYQYYIYGYNLYPHQHFLGRGLKSPKALKTLSGFILWFKFNPVLFCFFFKKRQFYFVTFEGPVHCCLSGLTRSLEIVFFFIKKITIL